MSRARFAAVLREHWRLTILRALAEMPSQGSNESTLTAFVCLFHPGTTRDQVRTEMQWLGEQGLLRVETIEDLMIARITKRGCDIASGAGMQPGVARPSPED